MIVNNVCKGFRLSRGWKDGGIRECSKMGKACSKMTKLKKVTGSKKLRFELCFLKKLFCIHRLFFAFRICLKI
jgi:hypothetical protein